MENLVQNAVDIGVGGIVPSYARSLLPHNSAGRPALWRRNLGRDTTQQADYVGFPPQGVAVDIGEKDMAPVVRYLVIPPTRGGYSGISIGGYGYLHTQAPEYGRTIHFDATYY